jgi:MGT family glycosyltransferase
MVVGHLCATAQVYAQDTIEALQRHPADLVVCFDMLLGPMVGCEAIGQRLALLGTMISFFPLKGIPPLGSALAPAETEAERAIEAQRAMDFETVFDCGLAELNTARAVFNLPKLAHVADQQKAAAIHWLGTARAFDFPSAVLKPNMRYAGPLVGDPSWSKPWDSPWPKDDPRPLVLVSFSTSFQDHVQVMQRIIDAAAPLPVRVLVTLGGAIQPEELAPAANCVLVHSAPHTQVMPEAALVITHGGHGTVMAALMNGLPMLVIPHGRDQGDNAVRITKRGAGLSLEARASVAEFRHALTRLLNDGTFRAAARQLGDAVVAEARTATLIDDLEALAQKPH